MSAASASAPRRKRRARGALPPQPDIAVFDARPTKSLARLLGYERCAVYSVVSNGDCLYRAVCEACHFEKDLSHLNVRTLRCLVAEAMDENTFAVIKCAHGDDPLIRGCADVLEYQGVIKAEGSDVGAGKCVWASDFAIRTIANTFELAFFIIDMQAATRNGRFCVVWPELLRRGTTTAASRRVRVVFLLRDRNGQHYDFVRVDDTDMLRFHALPTVILDCFAHCLVPLGLARRDSTAAIAVSAAAAAKASGAGVGTKRRRAPGSSGTGGGQGRGQGRGKGATGGKERDIIDLTGSSSASSAQEHSLEQEQDSDVEEPGQGRGRGRGQGRSLRKGSSSTARKRAKASTAKASAATADESTSAGGYQTRAAVRSGGSGGLLKVGAGLLAAAGFAAFSG